MLLEFTFEELKMLRTEGAIKNGSASSSRKLIPH